MSNMTDLWISGVFFSSSKYSKTRFSPGLCPGPRWVVYNAPPDLLVGWGARGHPSPYLVPMISAVGTFGASLVRSPTKIPGYAYDRVGAHIAPTHVLFKESNKYKLGNWSLMFASMCQMALASSFSSHFGPYLPLLFKLH